MELDLSNQGLFVLSDLSCYKNLTKLICSGNNLTLLDNLSDTIIVLDCSNNQLKLLDNLPDSIIEVRCSNNIFTYPFGATLYKTYNRFRFML